MRDIFPANVVSVAYLSPSVIQLVLVIGNMGQLQGTEHPDEWVSLWFPDDTGSFRYPNRFLASGLVIA